MLLRVIIIDYKILPISDERADAYDNDLFIRKRYVFSLVDSILSTYCI